MSYDCATLILNNLAKSMCGASSLLVHASWYERCMWSGTQRKRSTVTPAPRRLIEMGHLREKIDDEDMMKT